MKHLKGKHIIKGLSYQPEEVKALDAAGIAVIDIVTSGFASDELLSWAKWFRDKKCPCFAARMGHGSSNVKLWVRRTVSREGVLL